MNIAWVSFRELPDGLEDEWPAIAALTDHGHTVTPVVWDHKHNDPFDAWLIRTPWDYHLAADRFFDWLSDLESSGQRVVNSPDMMRRNIDKSYLLELRDAGITIPDTVLVKPDAGLDMEKSITGGHWPAVVLKPVIGANADDTWRIDNAKDAQQKLDDMLTRYAVIVQAYLPDIETAGEWSLMYFNGEYSHSALKLPASGDFRVQNERGGRVECTIAPDTVIGFGDSVIALLDQVPMYARVDCVTLDTGPCLMELELVEPELFFRCDERSAKRFADAFERYLATV